MALALEIKIIDLKIAQKQSIELLYIRVQLKQTFITLDFQNCRNQVKVNARSTACLSSRIFLYVFGYSKL
jgi:hypothetical protein